MQNAFPKFVTAYHKSLNVLQSDEENYSLFFIILSGFLAVEKPL